MNFVKLFKNISKNDSDIAGGKGASLGEMTQANIPVPPGFVVLSNAFQKFLEVSDINIEIDAILKTVDINAMHTVENASEKIQRLILEEKEIPAEVEKEIISAFKDLDEEYVAVRSSATAEDSVEAAWAGQLDSFLNTTEETLLQNVRKCWASLFTPRAIFYRFEKELDQTHISVAVVVQKMVNSEAAGIAFSVHPVTEDRNQIIIEAAYGLGEAVVSGQITPDSYVVTKEPRTTLDKNIVEQKKGLFRKQNGGNEWRETQNGAEQVLSDDEIQELSEVIIEIENHYGKPQDIEWAKEGNKVFIVQSRPITTLNLEGPDSKAVRFGGKEAFFKLGRWVAPVLEYEAWLDWSNTPESQQLEIPPEIDPAVVVLDGNYLMRVGGTGTYIHNLVLDQLRKNKTGLADSIIAVAESLVEESKAQSELGNTNASPRAFFDTFTLMSRLRFPWNACFSISSAIDEYLDEYAEKNDLDADSISSSISHLPNSLTKDQERLFEFKKLIQAEDLPFEFEEIQKVNKKLAQELESYQKQTEYSGTHHFWGEPRTIPRLMEAIEGVESTKIERPHNTIPALKQVLDLAARATKWRLECAETSSQLAYAYKPSLTALGEQLGLTYGQVIFLTTNEIKEAIDRGVVEKEEIARRQKAYGLYRENNTIHIITEGDLAKLEQELLPKEDFSGVEKIQGNVGRKGVVRGVVGVVLTPKDISKIEKGMILVAPETTPDFVPAMRQAAAFITDQGGVTSHAAIIAREMGKPCIIGTKTATEVLKDGDLVEVDANEGVVRILDKGKGDIKPEII